MSYITAIGTANPPLRFKQSQIADFMVRAMQLNAPESRKLRTIFKASGIEFRHSVLEDYGLEGDYTFYSDTDNFEPFPSTSKRLRFFRDHALNLSVQAVRNMLEKCPDFILDQVTHLITVSCTGLYAPGVDIELVKKLGLRTSVHRTGINFMGCYAAINALKVAAALCTADQSAKVLLVCVELCSLHFQKAATMDNLISNALFADGAAAVLIEHRTNASRRLVPTVFCSELLLAGANDMAWAIGDLGFEMKLSTYVPDILKGGVGALSSKVLDKLNKTITDVRYFAVHPGGRKILENVERELGLSKEQNEPAYHVLRNYGNMSSPTILFVLAEIMNRLKPGDQGHDILSLAFGPGLTLECMLLSIEIDP